MRTKFNKLKYYSEIAREQDSGLQKLTGSWRHRLRAPDSGGGCGNTWELTV